MGFFSKLFGAKEIKESEEVTRMREAAEAGDAKAMYDLCLAYIYGRGVKVDAQLSLEWGMASARAGYAPAQCDMASIYYDGNDFLNVEQDFEMAYSLYKMAAEQGEPDAICSIGVMRYNGYGFQKDYVSARLHFEQAAELGSVHAFYMLGLIYLNGYGTNVDYEMAVKYYRQAAEANHASAQNDLGYMYQNGYGVEKDTSMAVMWYRKAASQGEQIAIENLRGLGFDI